MEKFRHITDFLKNNKVIYKIISFNKDLDIICSELLSQDDLLNKLINHMRNHSFSLLTKNVPNLKGNLILYFYNKETKEELVLDIHSSDKIYLKNILKTYFNFNNLNNISYVKHDSYNNLQIQFKETLLPIKFYNKRNLFVYYYLLRGCLVIINNNKSINYSKNNFWQ